MQHHISISDAFKFGWQQTRAHSMLIFQVLLTIFAVEVAQSIVSKTIGNTLTGALANFALILLSIALGIGLTNIALKIATGGHAEYRDMLPPLSLCISFMAASLLAALVTVAPIIIGLIISLVLVTAFPSVAAALFVAPLMCIAVAVAVYFGLRYFFVRFSILENPEEITGSLRVSAHLAEGRKWWLLGFTLLMLLANIIGAILLLVGLLVSIPVTLIAYAHVYRMLRASGLN